MPSERNSTNWHPSARPIIDDLRKRQQATEPPWLELDECAFMTHAALLMHDAKSQHQRDWVLRRYKDGDRDAIARACARLEPFDRRAVSA